MAQHTPREERDCCFPAPTLEASHAPFGPNRPKFPSNKCWPRWVHASTSVTPSWAIHISGLMSKIRQKVVVIKHFAES